MKSIERLAMDIQGKTEKQAMEYLERYGFSIAEASEIVWQHVTKSDRVIRSFWMDIANSIDSTLWNAQSDWVTDLIKVSDKEKKKKNKAKV